MTIVFRLPMKQYEGSSLGWWCKYSRGTHNELHPWLWIEGANTALQFQTLALFSHGILFSIWKASGHTHQWTSRLEMPCGFSTILRHTDSSNHQSIGDSHGCKEPGSLSKGSSPNGTCEAGHENTFAARQVRWWPFAHSEAWCQWIYWNGISCQSLHA